MPRDGHTSVTLDQETIETIDDERRDRDPIPSRPDIIREAIRQTFQGGDA